MTVRISMASGRAIFGVLMMFAALPLRAQTESIIYNFKGGRDGSQPIVGLTVYKARLYSTILHGGAAGFGEIYKLAPPKTGNTWKKRALHSFLGGEGDDGGTSFGGVIAGQYGIFYGTNVDDGTGCCGVIYELSPPLAGETAWTEKIIYRFTGGADGDWPYGGLAVDQSGALYGATHFGGGSCSCGTIFRLHHDIQSGWVLDVLHTFAGGEDGSTPNGDLLIDNTNGYVFGTTPSGGAYGLGKVYALTPPTGSQTGWALVTIHDFEGDATDAQDGATPNSGLIGATGDLWGTTQSGGASINCCGMVFELRQEIAGDPNYTLINHHSFTGGQDGANPYAGLYEDSSHRIWGTTYYGGAGATGSDLVTIFELYPDALRVGVWHYIVAYSFNGGPNDGAYPEAPLVGNRKGVLYGTTSYGGQTEYGAVYEFIP